MKIKNCLLCLLFMIISCASVGCQDKKPADSGTAVTKQNVENTEQTSASASEASDLEIRQPNPTESEAAPIINEYGDQEIGNEEVPSNADTVPEGSDAENPSIEADGNSRSEVNQNNENINVEGNFNEYGEQELGEDTPETVNSDEEITNPTDEEGNEEL